MKPASCGVKAVGPLSQVWVLVDDVPVGLRSSSFLMAFSALIGKPVEVDAESLDKVGPARIKIGVLTRFVSVDRSMCSPLPMELDCVFGLKG